MYMYICVDIKGGTDENILLFSLYYKKKLYECAVSDLGIYMYYYIKTSKSYLYLCYIWFFSVHLYIQIVKRAVLLFR